MSGSGLGESLSHPSPGRFLQCIGQRSESRRTGHRHPARVLVRRESIASRMCLDREGP